MNIYLRKVASEGINHHVDHCIFVPASRVLFSSRCPTFRVSLLSRRTTRRSSGPLRKKPNGVGHHTFVTQTGGRPGLRSLDLRSLATDQVLEHLPEPSMPRLSGKQGGGEADGHTNGHGNGGNALTF